MNNKFIGLGLTVCIAVSLCTGCKIGDTDYVLDLRPESNKYLLTINDTSCDTAEARVYLLSYARVYGDEYGINLWDYTFEGQSLEEYVKDVTIDELVKVYSMDAIAQENEIQLTSDEEKLAQKAAKEYLSNLSKDEKAYIDISESELVTTYEHYALAEKLYNSMTQGVSTEVSDDDARVIRIHQIYVTDSDTAEEVAGKLKKGEDFDTLASTYNEASTVETTIARGDYPEQVDNVAFELDNDQISDQITTSEGYYFIKCISKNEEELTEENKAKILVEREQEQFNEAYDNFTESSTYNLSEDVWEDVTVGGIEDSGADTFFEIYDKTF